MYTEMKSTEKAEFPLYFFLYFLSPHFQYQTVLIAEGPPVKKIKRAR